MENVAQVLDNNRIKPSQNTFVPLFFPSTWSPWRQVQSVCVWEPSFIYDFNTNNNAQILGDDIAKKWNQLQIKEKNKKKKTQWITCTNYNLRIKKKLKTKAQEITLNKCKHWRFLCCNLFDYSCVPLSSYFPKSSLANFIYPKISRKEKHFSTETGKSSPSKNA